MPFAKHILAPTDFSQAAALSVRAAVALAKELGAKLTLVHVHDPGALQPPATVGWSAAQQRRLQEEIERTVTGSFAQLRSTLLGDVDADEVILRDSSPPRAICKYAEKIGADLIVISTHGRTGVEHLLIGSVAERVVRLASCPVLTLRSVSRD